MSQPQQGGGDSLDCSAGDPRYTLTDDERKAVIALKTACDAKGLVYDSIFELAKYVLVSHSAAKDTNPRAQKIRLDTAVKRITQRQKWRQKYGMMDTTASSTMEALEDLYESIPDKKYFVMEYEKECSTKRQVVGLHCAHSPNEYVFGSRENLSKYLQAESYRLDLAAADLQEARNGIVIVSIFGNEATVSTVFRFFRLLAKLQETLQGMHPNRIICLCVQVPAILFYLSSPARALMPKKIGQRLKMVKSLADLQEQYEVVRGASDDGSTTTMTVLEWAKQRQIKYDETVQKVTL